MDRIGDLLTAGSATDYALFGIGWLVGWALLARPRSLPRSATGGDPPVRPPTRVVIPARDEARQLPHLLPALVEQRRPQDTVVVVDDQSTDGTAEVAARLGATVVTAPALPDGWRGKPHACWTGAHTGDEPLLVFLDADVRPGATLLDELALAVADAPDAVVSVQPWHEMPTVSEEASLLPNVTALMGCGAFTLLGARATAPVAFGPVLALPRSVYDSVGGHADPTIRTMHTEDIGLARAVGRSRLYVGSAAGTRFRMYPGGLRDLLGGWTRSLATGARYARWWTVLATLVWVWSLSGGWLAAPIVYPLSALQIWVLGRIAGTTRWWAAVAFPLLVLALVVIFVRSLFALVFGRNVTWKDRRVPSRGG